MAAVKVPGSAKGGPYEAELPLDLGDRLPWLEGDDEAERDSGSGRVIAALTVLLILVGLAGGGLWYLRHRQQAAAMAVAGGVIKAPAGPYKVRPNAPGGTLAPGTGLMANRVAYGLNAREDAADAGTPLDLATPGAASSGAPGIGVQIGAYGSKADADKAWPTLAARYPVLSGLGHRVVEGEGDLGTVFGLQAVTATAAGAANLCSQLRASDLKCEIKG
jgi:hypothetical protein